MKRVLARAANRLLNPLGLRLERVAPDAFELQRRVVRKPRVIFDVGAHRGQTYQRYRQMFPSADIHSFEPFPESFRALQRAAAADPHAQVVASAVGNDETPLDLHSNVRSDTNSALPLDDRAAISWGRSDLVATGSAVQVPCTTLDRYCSQVGIEHIDILKIDVQGGELAVLRGAEGLLRAHRVSLVFLEVILVPTYAGQASLASYLNLFEAVDYELFDLCDMIRKARLLQTDVVFVPRGSARL